MPLSRYLISEMKEYRRLFQDEAMMVEVSVLVSRLLMDQMEGIGLSVQVEVEKYWLRSWI